MYSKLLIGKNKKRENKKKKKERGIKQRQEMTTICKVLISMVNLTYPLG